MAREFSIDNKGSAGIGVILWTVFMLVFLMIPFVLFFFELNLNILYGQAAGGLMDNALDQTEWHVQANNLSVAEVNYSETLLETVLEAHIQSRLSSANHAIQLEALKVTTDVNTGNGYRNIQVKGTFSYLPATYLGRLFSGQRIYLDVLRQRETPIDR